MGPEGFYDKSILEIDILKIVDKKSKWLIRQSTMWLTTFFMKIMSRLYLIYKCNRFFYLISSNLGSFEVLEAYLMRLKTLFCAQ